jgi:hypothetical protein
VILSASIWLNQKSIGANGGCGTAHTLTPQWRKQFYKMLSYRNPYPFERYCYHVCMVVYIPVLLPGWEDQPKMAGEDAGI